MKTNAWPSRSTAPLALLLWAMTGLSMAADDRRSAAAPGDEPDRRIRYLTHLRGNSSNVERYVVRGLCEQQGIRQISRILNRAELEEMWAFLPRARGTGQCQWHEIGRDEKSEHERSTVRVDQRYLAELMAENTEIHLVHYHPRKYFECAALSNCPKEVAAGRNGAFDKRWTTDLVFSMPSPSDVHFMMDATSRFVRHHQGQGTIRHSVVTPYGVVDYGLTDKGLARYDSERDGRSEGLYIPWMVASALDNDRIELVVREDLRSIGAAVRKLARTLNTDFLRVVHAPEDPGRAAALRRTLSAIKQSRR